MLYRCVMDDVVVYRSPVLDSIGVPHGFGTRHGDEHAIAEALKWSVRDWVTVRQVHGHAVHIIEDHSPVISDGQPRCEADAIVLKRPDRVARILTADCVPILLATTDGRVVAAVHAGWRGLVAGVIEQAVGAMALPFVAAIGPCISAAQFEVGAEVAERFDLRFVRRDLGVKPHVDLHAATYARLAERGALQIDTPDCCTYLHEDDFFSHRRDVTHRGARTTGRMASVIACGAE